MKNQTHAARFAFGLAGVILLALALAPAGAQTIPNPSFETNSFTVFPGYVDDNGGGINGWVATGTTRVGLNPANGSPFANNGATPHGANVAFVQSVFGNDGSLATTITGLTPGANYAVTFRANSRADAGGISPPSPT